MKYKIIPIFPLISELIMVVQALVDRYEPEWGRQDLPIVGKKVLIQLVLLEFMPDVFSTFPASC